MCLIDFYKIKAPVVGDGWGVQGFRGWGFGGLGSGFQVSGFGCGDEDVVGSTSTTLSKDR